MIELEIQIANRLGLHARAAARFVHLANDHASRISVYKGTARVDGKSILGLLTLAAAKGTRLRLVVEGEDEQKAMEALRDLIESRYGEDE